MVKNVLRLCTSRSLLTACSNVTVSHTGVKKTPSCYSVAHYDLSLETSPKGAFVRPTVPCLLILALVLGSLGCGGKEVDLNLRVEEFVFTKTKPPFQSGKPIDIKFVVKGFARNGLELNVAEDLLLIDPEGKAVLAKESVTVIHQELDGNFNLLTFTNHLTTNSGAPAGTYELTVTIRDLIGERRCTHAQTFVVKE